jgi:hypothetical protein
MGSHIIGLYSEVTKVKGPYHRTGVWQYIYNNRQVHQIGILYCLYKRDFSRRYGTGLYKRSVHKI